MSDSPMLPAMVEGLTLSGLHWDQVVVCNSLTVVAIELTLYLVR